MMIKDDEDSNECLKIESKKKNFETFDDLLPYIGDLGKYQWILITVFLPFGLAFTTIFFSQIFITAVPQKHWCKVNEFIDFNLTQEQRFKLVIPQKKYPFFDRCHYKKYNLPNVSEKMENYNFSQWETEEIIQCNQWEYDFNEIPYSSIGTELNWVCDQEYLVAAAQSIFYIGSICGNFLFGWISDRYGRKKGLLCCSATAFIASIGTANTKNFWSFAFCRFLMGFAFDNIINIPLIIVLEYTATRKRSLIAPLGVGINLSIGILILTWIAYFSRNWRILAYINSVPLIVCFLLTFLMPESIRWYVSKGKFEEIKKSIQTISEVNGKNPEFRIIDQFILNITYLKKIVENATLFDLRKTPALAKNSLLLSIIFAISSLILDVNIYYSNRYKISLFMSFTWFAIEAFLAGLLVIITANRWGRRFSGCLGLCLLTLFSCIFILVKSEIAKIIMGSLCRLIMSSVQCLFCLYIPEFFPTTLRTQGTALVHFLSVLMHFLAPYLFVLGSSWREMPIIILAVLGLLNSILILFLPETAGKSLRQTLEEGDNFCREKKFWPIFIRVNKNSS